MATISVKIKHQQKVYDEAIEIGPESTGEEFMAQVYSLTSVEPQNQKLLLPTKIKDDTNMSTVKIKPGQIITLIGKPSAEVVKDAPEQKIKFVEDMTEEEMAQQEGALPAGLQNTGNTCYANSSLQLLRTVPELNDVLQTYSPNSNVGEASSSTMFSAEDLARVGLGRLSGASDLTGALKDLYNNMKVTQGSVAPIMFLTALRQKIPQFAEKSKDGHGFAQQDAEELWSQLVQTLHQSLKLTDEKDKSLGYASWVEKYLGVKMVTTTESAEAPEEGSVTGTETFFDLKCLIDIKTGAGLSANHLLEGIGAALSEQIEKRSPSLNRDAVYTRSFKIARLPKYLPIHFLRFTWRKDTSKKAKILRKVSFQHEIDLLEFCTEDLRKKLIPIRDKIRDIRKDEEDVERAKKRQKRMRQEQADAESVGGASSEPLQKRKEKEKEKEKSKTDGDTKMEDVETYKTDAEIEAERATAILEAKKELLCLVHEDLKADPAANQTGLYELRGVITHKGMTADSGHYTAYVKKTAAAGKTEDGKWWWLNDDKVQEVDHDMIETLSGGGETHSALILLYRAVPLPTLSS